MVVDPFRMTIAAVPLVAYLLLLAVLTFRRRPFLTSGGSDTFALALALSGLVFIGPIELLRPEAAVAKFGNYVWISMLVFYLLWVLLFVLVSRPRIVVYNITVEELHPILAAAAAELDASARWAGNSLVMPALGIQLHIDDFALARNVTLTSSGNRQSLEGWHRLGGALAHKLRSVQVRPNPWAIGLVLTALLLMGASLGHMLDQPQELARAMQQVLQY